MASHIVLSSYEGWDQLKESLQEQLIAFYDDGQLDRDKDGNIIEAILINDLELAMNIRKGKMTPDTFSKLVEVVRTGMPMAAQNSKINVQSYMRSRRDVQRRL